MQTNYNVLNVWKKFVNIVNVILVVNAANKIDGSFVPPHQADDFKSEKSVLEDASDGFNDRSSVGYALKMFFTVAAVLLMSTAFIELAYHLRPYYRSIMMVIYCQMKQGLVLVIRGGMIFMYILAYLCYWLISNLFPFVRLSCGFFMWAASEASFVCWEITTMICSQMKLGLELVIKHGVLLIHWLISSLFRGGMIFMYILACLCSWLISNLFPFVRLSCGCLMWAASEASFVCWEITTMIYSQMKLGLEVVIKHGVVLIHWLISSLFRVVRLSCAFLMWAASEASFVCWEITTIIYSQMKLGLELVIKHGVVLIHWLISSLFLVVRVSYAFLMLAASKTSFVCWEIMTRIYSQMKLGLELVIKHGVVLIHWLISSLFRVVRLSCAFLMWAASEASFVCWEITTMIYSQMKLGLELIHWLISSLFSVVRVSYAFLMLAASKASFVCWEITTMICSQMKVGLELVIRQGIVVPLSCASSAVIFVFYWLVRNVSSALKGCTGAAKLVTETCPLVIKDWWAKLAKKLERTGM